MFEDFGFIDSLKTFYMNLSNLEYLTMILSLITTNELINSFVFDKKTGVVSKKYKNDDFEFYYFIYGIYIILYQMGRNNVIFFISFISSLLKQHLLNQYSLKDYKGIFEKNPELPLNIVLLQLFLQELANTFEIDSVCFDVNLHNYLVFKSISSD